MSPKPRLIGIGEVARAGGIGVETVRFYEKEGLLPKPARKPSGYRQYEPDVVRRIRFVQSAKELGFTLKEIRELLSLRVTRGKTCADVKQRAMAKLEDVDAKLADLRRMRDALAHLAATCTGTGPTSSCPLLDALDIQGADTPCVELLFFPGCPHVPAARELLGRAMDQAGMRPSWTEHDVSRPEAPEHTRGFGSPTILVDGRDVTGAAPSAGGSSCRVYAASELRGAPPLQSVVQALLATKPPVEGYRWVR